MVNDSTRPSPHETAPFIDNQTSGHRESRADILMPSKHHPCYTVTPKNFGNLGRKRAFIVEVLLVLSVRSDPRRAMPISLAQTHSHFLEYFSTTTMTEKKPNKQTNKALNICKN